MIEPDLTIALLATHYPLQPAIITIIGQPQAERQLYQVTTINGEQWLIRLCHAAAPSPIWLTVPSMAMWLHQQALVLEWCARHGYPAPRVLRTHTGELIATLTNWHMLVTQYFPGVTRATTLEARQSVAAVLGDLHLRSTALELLELQHLPWSWWAPLNDAITRAQHLFTALNTVPAEWADFIIMCQATLHQSQSLQTLPETIIHGDCWMGNAVTSPTSPTALIDWEYAGRGIAVLDLGCLLSDCLNVGEPAST